MMHWHESMKIFKTLTVDNQPYNLVKDDIRLELNSPGRATFAVLADHALSGIVMLRAGWSGEKTYIWFIGYVESSITISPQQQKLFCRELTAAMNRFLPLGLRHVTVRDVLINLSGFTDINFMMPDSVYMDQKSPYFYHLGDGYQAMDAIGRVYDIPKYLWQQLGDGSVFVGSWHGSRWADKRIQIPDNLFTKHMSTNSASLPMIPAIRPGAWFNRGIIHSVQLQEETMVISWKPSNVW